MAGNPKRRADLARLSDEPAVGEEVFQLLSDGVSLTRISCRLGLGKAALLEWLESTPERAELASRARARGGWSLADETLTIADEATDAELPRAKMRIGVRQWLAERYNRAALGEAKVGVAVNLNLGQLHLTAVKRRASDEVTDVTPKTIEQQLAEL